MDGYAFKKESLEEIYEVGDDIGSGHFAVVRRVTNKKTGHAYAAKFIRKRRGGGRKGARMEDIHKEVSILRQLNHNNVISLYDVYETNQEVILILELVTGGELFDYISEKDHLGEEEASAFIGQILHGLKHLHDNNIAHLDLKPENIMLLNRRSQNIKLIDFGLAQKISQKEDIRALMGTAEFVAPEVVSYESLSLATDMWSIGVITYILLSGASPFLGDSQQETYHNITAINYQFDEEYFSHTSDLAKDFIRKLFVKNPRKRATVTDCLNHPWIRPKQHNQELERKSAVINIDNFKAFMARKRWKQSMRVVSLCNRLSKSMLLRKSNDTLGSRNTLDEEKVPKLNTVPEQVDPNKSEDLTNANKEDNSKGQIPPPQSGNKENDTVTSPSLAKNMDRNLLGLDAIDDSDMLSKEKDSQNLKTEATSKVENDVLKPTLDSVLEQAEEEEQELTPLLKGEEEHSLLSVTNKDCSSVGPNGAVSQGSNNLVAQSEQAEHISQKGDSGVFIQPDKFLSSKEAGKNLLIPESEKADGDFESPQGKETDEEVLIPSCAGLEKNSSFPESEVADSNELIPKSGEIDKNLREQTVKSVPLSNCQKSESKVSPLSSQDKMNFTLPQKEDKSNIITQEKGEACLISLSADSSAGESICFTEDTVTVTAETKEAKEYVPSTTSNAKENEISHLSSHTCPLNNEHFGNEPDQLSAASPRTEKDPYNITGKESQFCLESKGPVNTVDTKARGSPCPGSKMSHRMLEPHPISTSKEILIKKSKRTGRPETRMGNLFSCFSKRS